MSTNKYLDSVGLSHLWSKIAAADSAVAGSKGGFIEYKNGFVQLWASEDASKVEGATPLSKFDASAFIADGMLHDTAIVTATVDNPIYVQDEDTSYTEGTFIKFEWQLADGSSKFEYLNAQKIGVIYEAGNGISLADDTIAVTSVQTDITKVTETIPVAGGPLADLLVEAGITEIEANTDMQALLFSLFCKEMWPVSSSFTDGSAKSTIAAPSFTLGNSGSTVEVGTKCTLSNVTIPSAAVASVGSYPTVSGFTYGYSADDDNTQDSTATSISASVKTAASLNSDNYQLAIDFTGFNSVADDSATPDASHSNVSYTGKDLIATVGTNIVKATVTGPKATVTFNSIPSYYACSNVKKTHNTDGEIYHKSDVVSEKSYTSGSASNSKSLSVTAKYKYFYGYSDIKSTDSVATFFDSAKVRALTTQSGFLETSGSKVLTAGESDGRSLVVAFPSTYELSDAKYTDGSDMKANFSMSGTVSVACDSNADYTTNYTVMVFPVDATAKVGFKDITIKKK